MIVVGSKSVEELYPSSLLGVDSAKTSQLSKEKNLHGQFQPFQITQPGSSTVVSYTSVPTEGSYTRALWVCQDRRHLFVTP